MEGRGLVGKEVAAKDGLDHGLQPWEQRISRRCFQRGRAWEALPIKSPSPGCQHLGHQERGHLAGPPHRPAKWMGFLLPLLCAPLFAILPPHPPPKDAVGFLWMSGEEWGSGGKHRYFHLPQAYKPPHLGPQPCWLPWVSLVSGQRWALQLSVG